MPSLLSFQVFSRRAASSTRTATELGHFLVAPSWVALQIKPSFVGRCMGALPCTSGALACSNSSRRAISWWYPSSCSCPE